MTTKISGDNISAIANTGVTWNAVTVADGSTQLNASVGNGYFLDTNAGVIDVKLPTSPTRGDTIILADYGNNFATNRVVVDTGGKKIDSVVGGEPGSGGFTIETNGAVVELIFADDTAGWIIKQNSAPSDLGAEDYATFIEATGGTVTTSGDFKIHTFTGDGCFVVTGVSGVSANNEVSYIVVAGGGGGAAGSTPAHGAGGGGAGGFRESKSGVDTYSESPLAGATDITVTASTYPITVGGGGPSGPGCANARGTAGSNSVFSTITSAGGGGGGGSGAAPFTAGGQGGSGGGGSSEGPSPCGTNPSPTGGGSGGQGNVPAVSPAQGFGGGYGNNGPSPVLTTGGGGGATTVGANGNPASANGTGGSGATTGINGSNTTFSGGGGGGGTIARTTGGNGGPGGGANGVSPNSSGSAATANTGGGGGGGGGGPPVGSVGTNGGSGIVIIRYKFQ